jgi:hypothetical protein
LTHALDPESWLPSPGRQLAEALAWLAAAAPRGALPASMIYAIVAHQRSVQTDPSILITATVRYLATRKNRDDDRLNRYWHIVDQVSAQARARYQGVEEKDLR